MENNNIITENIEKFKTILKHYSKLKSNLIFREDTIPFVPEDLADILFLMLKGVNKSQRCVWVNKITNRKRNQISGSTRSLFDMYSICKSYIPDITVTHIDRSLSVNHSIGSWYCPNVKRRVYNINIYNSTDREIFKNKMNELNLNIKI